jgi:hypothetical protein
MENRHGLGVRCEVHPAVDAPEAQIAVRQIAELPQRGLRAPLAVKVRAQAHDLRQGAHRKIEEIFGWAKTTRCFRKSRYLGVARTPPRRHTSWRPAI